MNVQQQQPWEMPPPPTYEEVQKEPRVDIPPSPPVVPVPAPAVTPVEKTTNTGTTGFGRMFGILGSGMGLLLGLALLIGSALLMFRRKKAVEKEATVVSVTCKENTDKSTSSKALYTCELELKYTDAAEKEVVVKKTIDSNTYYSAGQKITVYYSSENPTDVELKASDNKTLGWILFAIGMTILVASSIGMYFTLRAPAVISPVV